ncbi:MAG: MBL fold metallo-hydrolase [Bacteroidales bacterium]|nr:MBL fold metallo-hydrolase [Bacteroidales bacterium]
MAKRTLRDLPGQFAIDFENTGGSTPPAEELSDDNRLYYLSFGSGSSGNSCYIGTRRGGVIIDAGVNDADVERILAENSIPMSNVKAILLTHDHTDHIKYVYKLLRTNKNLRLYCTNRVLLGILRRHSISKRIKEFHNPVFKEIPFRVLDFEITAFEVPHDGSDNVGYSISYNGVNFVLATDLGAIPARAEYYMSRANYLVIEANYDLRMLLNGSYPEHLKARIQTERGHLDNEVTAAFLSRIYTPALRNVFLCHLSKDNNRPEIALSCVRSALEKRGVTVGDASNSVADRNSDIHICALPRFEGTPLFVFRT